MGTTAHGNDEKREILEDHHRLADLRVRLVNSTNGEIEVMNGVDSSLV